MAISPPNGDNWQWKALVVGISDPLLSIVRREFSSAAYPVWKHFFFQQEHKKCKLFLEGLVSDCFGYVFSRPLFNKHFRYAAIEKVNTINERRSKIVINRVFDCRLPPIGDKWQSKTLFLAICDPHSSVVQSFLIASSPI